MWRQTIYQNLRGIVVNSYTSFSLAHRKNAGRNSARVDDIGFRDFGSGAVDWKLEFSQPTISMLVLNCAVFAGLGVIVGLSVRSLESVGLYNNFIIIPMSFLGATFFDPGTLPAALKVVVYLLPLTYASIGLRAAAHLPLSQFPWYSIPILLVIAIALSVGWL